MQISYLNMQNLEWYLTDLKSTGKNTIEIVEKSLTDTFIRLLRIYPCLNYYMLNCCPKIKVLYTQLFGKAVTEY